MFVANRSIPTHSIERPALVGSLKGVQYRLQPTLPAARRGCSLLKLSAEAEREGRGDARLGGRVPDVQIENEHQRVRSAAAGGQVLQDEVKHALFKGDNYVERLPVGGG